jgi:putative oxidoreductase
LEAAMIARDHFPQPDSDSHLLPSAATGATLLRFILATWWMAHWWYKVGVVGMPGTESFFIHEGLPAWLAWFDISFEVVVTACLVLGVYVPLVSLISLPILVASMIIFSGDGFYFYPSGGIELPVLWSLVQIVQALLGPGDFRITPPRWLPRVPVFHACGP